MVKKYFSLRSLVGLEPVYAAGRRQVHRSFSGLDGKEMLETATRREIYVEFAESKTQNALQYLLDEDKLRKDSRPIRHFEGENHSMWDRRVQVFEKGIPVGQVVLGDGSYSIRFSSIRP
jgi:hypothetical protein